MGTTKAGEENIRRLVKNSSGAYTVTIPIAIVRALRWQQNQRLTVEYDSANDTVVITDWEPSS